MNDIAEILRNLLDRNSQASDAEREFRSMMREDRSLKEDYKEWCEEQGYDIKTGYQDYIDELLETRDSIWDDIEM